MTTDAPKVTALTETAALYWLIEDRPDQVARIVSGMYPNERREFAAQLDRLRDALGRGCDACETPTPDDKVPAHAGRRHLCENCAGPEPQESRQSA